MVEADDIAPKEPQEEIAVRLGNDYEVVQNNTLSVITEIVVPSKSLNDLLAVNLLLFPCTYEFDQRFSTNLAYLLYMCAIRLSVLCHQSCLYSIVT